MVDYEAAPDCIANTVNNDDIRVLGIMEREIPNWLIAEIANGKASLNFHRHFGKCVGVIIAW